MVLAQKQKYRSVEQDGNSVKCLSWEKGWSAWGDQ